MTINNRSNKTRRIKIQPGAKIVTDAAGLVPVSSENDFVLDSNITPQSCPLTIAQSTPDSIPNKSVNSTQKSTPDTAADEDDNESSSSQNSEHSKKQTQYYGSPIRHAVKEVSETSSPAFSGGATFPVSAEELSSSTAPRKRMRVLKRSGSTDLQKKEN